MEELEEMHAYLTQPGGSRHIALEAVEGILIVFEVGAGVVSAAAICARNVLRCRGRMAWFINVVGGQEGVDRVGHAWCARRES